MSSIPPGFAHSGRSVRQSGLKKPRALLRQSVSVQDKISDEAKIANIPKASRQVSLEDSRKSGSTVTTNGKRPELFVCEEIAAMSARVASEAQQINKFDNTGYSEKPDATDFFTKQDFGYNNIDTRLLTSHSCVDDVYCDRRSTHQDEASSAYSSPKNNMESRCSGRGRYRQKDVHDENSRNVFSPASESDGIAVATLITGKGEELVLTGRNMKTILCASRVLLREFQAKIIKIEYLSDDELSPLVQTPEKDRSLDDSFEAESSAIPSEEHRTLKVIKYSKDKLLILSQSPFSVNPPAMWNLISGTHSDVCVPAEKVKDYFDPDFFSFHDGTLVVAEQLSRKEKDLARYEQLSRKERDLAKYD